MVTSPSLFGNLSTDHLTLVVVGYVVVFLSLSLLWFVFYHLPILLNFRIKLSPPKETSLKSKSQDKSITGEETAAISAALFLFIEQLHDEENTVLTIQKISRRYSPWSSKIYSVTKDLDKRF